MTTVLELSPGDVVDQGGMSATHIAHTSHPLYPALQLVVWRMADHSVSLDALHADQHVGEVRASDRELRHRALLDALHGGALSDLERPDDTDYRMLCDAVFRHTNPADDDVAEVSIALDCVARLVDVVTALPCTCPPGSAADNGIDGACARCRALGRFGDVRVDW